MQLPNTTGQPYNSHMVENLLSAREFAELHGISPSYVYYLLQEGRIAGATRVGSRWLIPANAEILQAPASEYKPDLGKTRVITFFNYAGGVGKTTLTRDLGAELSSRGYRVLLIDADPQGNLTSWLGIEGVDPERTLYGLFRNGVLPEPIKAHGIDVIPAHLPMARLEVEISQVPVGEQRLRRALEEAEGRWDLVLIDSPPSLGRISVMAALAGEGFVVPVEVSRKGLEGLILLLDLAEEYAKAVGVSLPRFIKLIVPTKYDPRTSIDNKVMSYLRELPQKGFKVSSSLGARPGIHKRAAARSIPIPLLEPAGKAAKEIKAIANELLNVLVEGNHG